MNSILLYFLFMFFRKKRSSSELNQTNQQDLASPLPKLQELTRLEGEMVSILGKKNVSVDTSADVFTRLEQIYINSLQSSALGMEMLEKCLRIIGEFDSPMRVKFLYFYAHEMKVKGAAVDEVQPVLLESFHSNLSLKNKVEIGFKSGLTFCQISEHCAEVDKILSSLIISLQQELGYKPHKKVKAQSGQVAATKSIYLGTRLSNQAQTKNSPHNKLERLEYYKFLFEAFVTGSFKIKSEAKRKYYSDCAYELKRKIIRQYPGIEIDKKLDKIQEQKFSRLVNFGKRASSTSKKEQVKANRSTSKTRFSRGKVKSINRSKSQFGGNSTPQSLKNSFCNDENPNPPLQAATWTAPSKSSGFKLHLRKKSQHKLTHKEQGQAIEMKEQQVVKQQVRPEITKLLFKQVPQNTPKEPTPENINKGIKLKFDRLAQGDIKKKKLVHNFRWQRQKQAHKQNQLERVLDVIYLPEIKEETVFQHKNTSIKEESIVQPRPIEKKQTISQSILGQQNFSANPSTTQVISTERIDKILEESVQWANRIQSEIYNPCPSKHASSYSECSLIKQQNYHEQCEQQLAYEQEPASQQNQIEQSASLQKQYKIIIKPLQKPQVNVIVLQEIQTYMVTLGQTVIKQSQTAPPDFLSKIIQSLQKALQLKEILTDQSETSIELPQVQVKDQHEDDKENTIINEWVKELQESISQRIAMQAHEYLILSCVESYCISLNLEVVQNTCLAQQHLYQCESEVSVVSEKQRSFDDNDKESQMPQSDKQLQNSREQCQIIENKESPMTPSIVCSDKNEFLSQLSKIETLRQNAEQSQMNIINEYFINDKMKSQRELAQVDTNEHLLGQRQSLSQASNLKNEQEGQYQNMKRSAKKQSTHICLTIRYSEDYDKITQQSKTFNHWLSPQLNANNGKITFTIKCKQSYTRQQLVPAFAVINDDMVKEISLNIDKFLIKHSQGLQLTQQIDLLIKEFNQIDLLPEELLVKPFQLIDEQGNNQEIRCFANIKLNRIIFQSQKLTVHPIHLDSQQQLQRIIGVLSPEMMMIKKKELIVKDVWSYLSQRNIKLFEKSYNSTHHFIFDFLERCRQDFRFDYEIREQSGGVLRLQGMQMKIRQKIIKNVDTIIGFCLKMVKGRVEFQSQGINLFVNML